MYQPDFFGGLGHGIGPGDQGSGGLTRLSVVIKGYSIQKQGVGHQVPAQAHLVADFLLGPAKTGKADDHGLLERAPPVHPIDEVHHRGGHIPARSVVDHPLHHDRRKLRPDGQRRHVRPHRLLSHGSTRINRLIPYQLIDFHLGVRPALLSLLGGG